MLHFPRAYVYSRRRSPPSVGDSQPTSHGARPSHTNRPASRGVHTRPGTRRRHTHHCALPAPSTANAMRRHLCCRPRRAQHDQQPTGLSHTCQRHGLCGTSRTMEAHAPAHVRLTISATGASKCMQGPDRPLACMQGSPTPKSTVATATSGTATHTTPESASDGRANTVSTLPHHACTQRTRRACVVSICQRHQRG